MIVKNKSGLWGEIFAARYLRDRKVEILSTNYTCRLGEIDIIAFDKDTYVFVEVKTREVNTAIPPAEAVDVHKQNRMTATAQLFMRQEQTEGKMRFDVAEVFLNADNSLHHIHYIANAFSL